MSDLRATWRDDAACRNHPYPELWDRDVEGERPIDQERRHTHAVTVCGHCPVVDACLTDVDWTRDQGIRGGVLLPELQHAARPYRERREIVHGRAAGYAAHRRQGEDPCEPCRRAFRQEKQDYRARWRHTA